MDNLGMVDIAIFVLGTISSILGYYIKKFNNTMHEIRTELTEIKEAQNKHELEDARNLVTKVELMEFKEDIRDMLGPINTKLSNIESHLLNRMH